MWPAKRGSKSSSGPPSLPSGFRVGPAKRGSKSSSGPPPSLPSTKFHTLLRKHSGGTASVGSFPDIHPSFGEPLEIGYYRSTYPDGSLTWCPLWSGNSATWDQPIAPNATCVAHFGTVAQGRDPRLTASSRPLSVLSCKL